jgi:hypothetical protein
MNSTLPNKMRSWVSTSMEPMKSLYLKEAVINNPNPLMQHAIPEFAPGIKHHWDEGGNS